MRESGKEVETSRGEMVVVRCGEGEGSALAGGRT
jgi:hypothetical protein